MFKRRILPPEANASPLEVVSPNVVRTLGLARDALARLDLVLLGALRHLKSALTPHPLHALEIERPSGRIGKRLYFFEAAP